MKMKRKHLLVFLVLLPLVVISIINILSRIENFIDDGSAVKKYAVYEFQDWIYYDPVNGSANCNGQNYWTVNNTDTTCYRFFMIKHKDTSLDSTVKLVLDHDVAVDSFEKINEVLANTKSVWGDYTGPLSVMSENEIMDAMKLNVRPTLNGSISVCAPNNSPDNCFQEYRFTTNTLYYKDGAYINDAGWWSSDLYPSNNNYAYTITEYGNNRLTEVSSKRGIRPTIVLEKNKISGSSQGTTDITSTVSNAGIYKYTYDPNPHGGYIYKQMQGFTVTNNNLVFYSSNNGDPENGLIFGYTGNDYSVPVPNVWTYIAGGHGNDMTFDSKNNKLLLVGPNNYDDIWFYDGTTLEYSGKKELEDGFTAIAYDEINDYYIGNKGRRAYVMNKDFEILYSFDIPHDEVGQGFEYHNGYLYQTSSMFDCPSYSYQFYCSNFKSNSSIINIYSAKLDANGKPSRSFGHRVGRLVIDGDSNFGEVESIAFHNGEVILGFAAQSIDSQWVYQFRHFNYTGIATDLSAHVDYSDLEHSTTATISSMDQMHSVPGYTLSEDGYSMTKTVDGPNISDNLNLCDDYGSCTNVNISHTNTEYRLVQTVSFPEATIDKTYGDGHFTSTASTDGDGTISYASNDTSVATVDSATGEVTITGAGTATITATASKTDTYSQGSASYTINVSKARSARPSELDNTFRGIIDEPLSNIPFATPGISWINGTTLVLPGDNEYQVEYVQNNDTRNYTTETFNAVVNGSSIVPYDVTISPYLLDDVGKYLDLTNFHNNSDDFVSLFDDLYTIVVETKNVEDKIAIYTGGSTKIYRDDILVDTYTNIIRGDANGDGDIRIADYIKIKKDIMDIQKLQNEYRIAGDVNQDNRIGIQDYIKIKKMIMNDSTIQEDNS